MEIKIKYKSIWGNSFLSSPEDIKRKYIASSKGLKNKDNYKKRDIEITTVYGLLYRFMGARHSLSKLLNEDNSIINGLIKNGSISFENIKSSESNELVYLRNNANNTGQYSGVPDESLIDMGLMNAIDVLFFNRTELIDYLVNDKKKKIDIDKISIIDISKKIEEIYKDKSLNVEKSEDKDFSDEYKELNKAYKKIINKDIDKDANIGLLAINKSTHENFKNKNEALKYLTTNATFTGVSLNGNSFTLKNFMEKFASSKISYGNPYQIDLFITNPHSKESKKMKINKKLTKSDGLLTIKIDCDRNTAQEIKEYINNAGVSAFYLGKKGLAYIDKITL